MTALSRSQVLSQNFSASKQASAIPSYSDLSAPIKTAKSKNQGQLPLSPPNDFYYTGIPETSQFDMYNAMNFMLPSTQMSLHDDIDGITQMDPYLTFPELPWIPSCDTNGVISHHASELIQNTSSVTWGQLTISPQQSSDSENSPTSRLSSQLTALPPLSFPVDNTSMEPCLSNNQKCTKSTVALPCQTNSLNGSGKQEKSSGATSSKCSQRKTSTRRSSSSSSNSNDTDELRLKRNREAAAKCRQKKKEYVNRTKKIIQQLNTENEQLQEFALKLREEIIDIKLLLANEKH